MNARPDPRTRPRRLVTDTPEAPPPAPPPPPPVTKLAASVSAGGGVHLSRSSVPAGRVRVAVTDRSRMANYHLAGTGLNTRTGMKFRGSTSWSLRLAAGRYRYGTDGRPLTGRLRVK